MAAHFVATGMQAFMEGVGALADHQQMKLSAQLRKEATLHRRFEVQWRREDMLLKKLERYRRKVDQKRHIVDEKVKQLSLLAELCAFMGAFQMIMLYEEELPDLETYWYADPLLALWGIGSLSVACTDLCVMVIAAFVNFDILEISSREGVDEFVPLKDLYTTDGLHPEGAVVAPEAFLHIWYVRYDRIFRGMVTAFSYTVPLFMINLGLQTHVKFYQSLPITWTSFVVCLMGVLVWYRCHSALVSHLLWQPRGSSGVQGEVEESGRWDTGRSGSFALSEESGVAYYRGTGWQGDSGSRGAQCLRGDADRRGFSPSRRLRGSVTRSESPRSVRRDSIARSESPWSDQESSVASAASSVAESSEIHLVHPQHLLMSSGVRKGGKDEREVGM